MCAGSTAWMLPLSAIAYWNGSHSLAIITFSTFLITVSVPLLAWRFRERLDAYNAIPLFIGLVFVMTIIVLAGIQFLVNTDTQKLAQWTPWCWCILFIFPVLSLPMWWTRRAFKLKMRLTVAIHLTPEEQTEHCR